MQHYSIIIIKNLPLRYNLGKDAMTIDYVKKLRQIQERGHEMMDHTPMA